MKIRTARASKSPFALLAASTLAASAIVCAASSAEAATGTLPMALTSYLDTTANVIHVFYLGSDGAVYTLSAPVAKAASASGWSCSPALPAMSDNTTTHYSSVVTGGMIPGSNLASSYDGANGHLYYIGSDGGVWGATGNPPYSATGQSLNAIVGGGVAKPTSQATSYCIPSTKYSYGQCFQGVMQVATVAAAASGNGIQNVFYEGTDDMMHNLVLGAGYATWTPFIVGTNGANALNGKGLSATYSFGTQLFFDDAVGDAEVWSQFLVIKSGGGVGGIAWTASDTLDVDFQGFLASSQLTVEGEAGIVVAGPDPSSVPTIDTASNAGPTGAWSTGHLSESVAASGPMVIVDAGYKNVAPNGTSSWLFYVGQYGNIRTGANAQLTGLTGNSGVTPATSTANTVYSPLSGLYTTADSTVHVFYIGDDGNVYELNLPEVSGGTFSHPSILPSNCPSAMY